MLNIFENIFTYEGNEGHEVILLFEANFLNKENNNKDFDINEGGQIVGKAVWKSIEEIKCEGSKLYPVGIESFM